MAVLAGLVAIGIWWHFRTPEPTVLAFRLGQTFEQVVRESSYPAMERSNRPAEDPGDNKFGAIWVTEPAVIIHFTDPKHGFTLPPTKFAALTFSQNQFKAGGWEPWEENDSTWFDLTPEGKKRLHARMFEPGYMQSTNLRVPKLYGMTFRLKCTGGCWTREPPYLFLIDIGVGDDYGREPDNRFRWEQPGNALTGSSVR